MNQLRQPDNSNELLPVAADAALVRWLDPNAAGTPKSRSAHPRTHLADSLHAITVAGELATRVVRNLFPGRLYRESWQGTEPGSGAPLHAIYVGNGDNRAYLHSIVFAAPPPPLPATTLHWLQLRGQLSALRSQADLVLIDLGAPLYGLIGAGNGIVVPTWVKQRVPIADTWEAVLGGLRRKTRREVIRLINKHGFRARVVPGTEVGQSFYRNLYRPYIEQRYQDGAALVDEQRFVRECRGGYVIELVQSETVVGAALLRHSNTELSVVWTGLDTSLSREEMRGITDALDFFSLRFAFELGCDLLNLGGSRADLQDGLFRYKRKWGARVDCGKVPHSQLRICPQRASEGVRSFLSQHSFIALDGNELVGKLWLGSEPIDNAGLDDLGDRYGSEGLARCELLLDTPLLSGDPCIVVFRRQGMSDWRRFWQIDLIPHTQ